MNRLFRCFDDTERLTLPMTRIVKFAMATAVRLDEICRVEWADLDVDRRMLLIRDRKDPRNKTGNDQRIPLFAALGFTAWALVKERAKVCPSPVAGSLILALSDKVSGTGGRMLSADGAWCGGTV
jgi:integrase